MPNYEEMAKALDECPDYKVLKRLEPKPRKIIDYDGPVRKALVLDLETTGLSCDGVDGPPDEVIELAAVPIAYTHSGLIVEILPPFCALREPTKPIPTKITELTGITAEMVRGRTINPSDLAALLADVDLVVAHNAGFDRPFAERLFDGFKDVRWACSQSQLPWGELGYAGTKLSYLLAAYNLFHDGHRAKADAFALAEILTRPLGSTDRSVFSFLIEEAFRSSVRLYAVGAPYDKKDVLRQRSYRWSAGGPNRPRAWYRDLPEAEAGQELDFLYASILPAGAQPILKSMDGRDRFSERA